MVAKSTLQIAISVLGVAGLLLTGDAVARSTDRHQPIDISADAGVSEQAPGKPSTLNGNIVITQGSLVINASKGSVYVNGGNVSRVILSGSPVRLRQTLDSGEPLTVNASQADYNLTTDTVVLTGNVRISQPSGNLSAPQATYNMSTGRFESKASSSGRVRMRFVPKSDQQGK